MVLLASRSARPMQVPLISRLDSAGWQARFDVLLFHHPGNSEFEFDRALISGD